MEHAVPATSQRTAGAVIAIVFVAVIASFELGMVWIEIGPDDAITTSGRCTGPRAGIPVDEVAVIAVLVVAEETITAVALRSCVSLRLIRPSRRRKLVATDQAGHECENP